MGSFKEEYIKCYQDKSRQYFIQNYLKTFDASQNKEVPFQLFPRQKVFLNNIVKYSNNVAIKPRQCGITTVSSAWATGQMVFASKDAPETILCIGNKLDISQQLVTKIGTFLDQVPRWMWGSEYYSPNPEDPKNLKTIYVKRNKDEIKLFNGCRVVARSSGTNAARGISAVSILIFDEAAFIENSLEVYAQAVAATASVKGAKIIMVSTPNGKDQLYYRTYNQALKGENNYHATEFRWYQDPRYNKFLKWFRTAPDGSGTEWYNETLLDTKGTVEYNEEHWKKLVQEGWTPLSPWYENMCKSFNNDDIKINQELNVSFLGSSDNVVDPEIIEMHQKQNVRILPENWELGDPFVKETWIWKQPIEGHRYICACLPEGEKILTQRGEIEVQNVNDNDLLLAKEGEWTKIKYRKYRDVIDEDIVEVKINNLCGSYKFTHNHPIWSSTSVLKKCTKRHDNNHRFNEKYWEHNFEFKNASDIKEKDWLIFPNLYYNKDLSNDIILSNWDYEIDDINPLLMEDFWWYCGMWLAEGCCVKDKNDNYRIYTSHHMLEISIHQKIKNIINNVFHRKTNSNQVQNGKALNIFFNHNKLANWLINNFGKGAHGKFISEWIKYIPYNLKKALLDGYIEGDGSISKHKRDGLLIKISSVSKQLLIDVQDILFSMGIVSDVTIQGYPKEKFIIDTVCKQKEIYCLCMGSYSTKQYLDIEQTNLHKRRGKCYLSDDNKFIYIQVRSVIKNKYTGRVYNYETEDESHTFSCRGICTHNCDPSSGSAEDSTAIVIIDIDAVDEKGTPFYEQVLEYNGKVTGDIIGGMLDSYGRQYNNALVVVEDIGGWGNMPILTLLSLGYPNLYYDDPGLKNPTIQKKYMDYGISENEKLPGFHTQSARFPMISNFVRLLKNNQYRIRSKRTIAELDTWVFKNGRPDHQSGCHDDLLTCTAMGLYVMEYSMIKMDQDKNRSKAMVAAWTLKKPTNGKVDNKNLTHNFDIRGNAKNQSVNYFSNGINKQQEKNKLNAMLLLSGFVPNKK